MDRKCLKALKNINRLIDGDYQKLCDQMHNLELSHNRKKKALQKIRHYCIWPLMVDSTTIDGLPKSVIWRFEAIKDLCEDALFSDGRERMKGVKDE